MRVADALGHLAGDQIVQRLECQRADGGIDQSGVDVAAAAGLFPPRQRREDADRRIDAGENIGDRHADAQRRSVGGAGQTHDAAHALGHQIVTRPRCIRAGLAEAGHRAVDQPRISRRETCIVETELLQAADLEILDQHVRARRELLDDALALGGLEIELDRTLAAVGAMEIGRRQVAAVGGRHERRAPGAGVVARALALHLDHVGAEIGENLARPRPRQNAGKLQNAQTSQRTRHEQLPVIANAARQIEKMRPRPHLTGAGRRLCLLRPALPSLRSRVSDDSGLSSPATITSYRLPSGWDER